MAREIEIDTEAGSGKNKRLTNITALTVVLFSVFLAIQGIKSGNVAQAIDQTKADVLNKWNQYQASRLKHDMSEATLVTNNLFASVPGVDAKVVQAEREKSEKANAFYAEREKKYAAEAKELTGKLEGLNARDDQYDVAEALLTIAIATAAVAILAESWWIVVFSWVVGGFGLLLGGGAMAGINLNPEWLVKLFT